MKIEQASIAVVDGRDDVMLALRFRAVVDGIPHRSGVEFFPEMTGKQIGRRLTVWGACIERLYPSEVTDCA